MSHGFLGYDGSTFMFDFVVTALVLIVPALLVSLYLVKVQRNYTAHRNLQLALAGVLLTVKLLTVPFGSTAFRVIGMPPAASSLPLALAAAEIGAPEVTTFTVAFAVLLVRTPSVTVTVKLRAVRLAAALALLKVMACSAAW